MQSSELSRNSAAVFAAAEQGPVDITRRDGEGFVLLRAADAAKERQALAVAAEFVTASLSTSEEALSERLRGPFPWVEFLSPSARAAFAEELLAVTRACAAVGQFRPLLVTFEAGRSTAEAIAAGYPPDSDLPWLNDGVRVADPRHG